MADSATHPLSNTVAFSGDPLWRWKSVHQSFFLIIQGITTLAHRFETSLAAGDMVTAERALQQIVKLLRGSAAAMRLAGSMSTSQYQQDVRPTMMQGDLPEGFSGIMGADHIHMVRSLSKVRNALVSWPQLHALLEEAIDYCYDAHERVCERAEPNGLSLMAAAHDSTVGGIQDLRRGGKLRKRTIAKIYPPDRVGD